MCGFAGIFDRPRRLAPDERAARVERMATTLAHRGPDDAGVWQDDDAGIALGHRRLAIIDLTAAGHQPMTSSCGRYVISYNGEIYNFREIAAELNRAGRAVAGRSDTAVLVEACAEWGIEGAIERCVGMFAFALFDKGTRALYLVRDRLGIKPLYWSQAGETIVFGSELKALEASGLITRAIDRAALADYLKYAYIPAPATIYENTFKLPPGHLLTVPANGAAQLTCYWDVRAVARLGQGAGMQSDPGNAQDRLEELLSDAVRSRLVSDVPLGALLSGGIDSSTVTALMQAASTRPVKTFSIGFAESGYDESENAAAIARYLGTDHTGLTVTPGDALATIPELATWYDEPFADSSQIPTLLLSRLTRQHVTVALSGDGGDEVFAGYNRYRYLPGLWRRAGLMPHVVRRPAIRALTMISPNMWDSLARIVPARHRPRQFGEKVWKAAGALGYADFMAAYESLLSPWHPATRLVAGATGSTAGGRDRGLVDPVAQMQLADTLAYLPGDILTKVDRASMAASLEVRVPLLDHRVVEHAWSLPRSWLMKDGGKAPLRHILDKYVPRALVDRPKSGFGVPIDSWLRGPLRGWAEDLLTPRALAMDDLLDPALVQETWQQHLSGQRNNQHALWTVLMFQAWRQRPLASSA